MNAEVGTFYNSTKFSQAVLSTPFYVITTQLSNTQTSIWEAEEANHI